MRHLVVCVCVRARARFLLTCAHTAMTFVLSILLMLVGVVLFWWFDRENIEAAMGWGGE